MNGTAGRSETLKAPGSEVVAKYGISTYGKTYLIDEGITETPTIRYILILINILLLTWMTVRLTRTYLTQRRSQLEKDNRNLKRSGRSPLGSLTPFFVSFTINNLIRGVHMIDHTCRPVYYHEPKWAYAKILIAEMELPTYANVFITGFGFIALEKALRALGSGNRDAVMTSLIYMIFFLPISAFNLIHYTIEPPWNYGPFPNFNIAGSGITTIPLILLIIHTYLTFENYQDKNASKDSKSRARLISKDDNDDNADGETSTPRRSTRHIRRRSKTPVKK